MAAGPIKVNARFYAHRPTGMQRYAIEVSRRFPAGKSELIRPNKPLNGVAGHAWEQLYLPIATGKHLLWSPNNTGPIAVSRQVCTIHDLIPLEFPEWFSPRFVALYRWLMPKLAPRLQHIVAISEFTKQRVMELLKVDEKRISVVHNGVDSIFIPQTPEKIADLRKRMNLGEKPYALCVGSVEPRKNLKTLLEAWAILPDSIRKEYQLVLTGATGSSSVFRQAKLGQVPPDAIFTGYVAQEDLPVLYAGASVFIYPSLYEGFGLPPLEAMAVGTPVVTSNTSSLPEVVLDSASLVDPQSVESIAHGIEQTLTDETLRERHVSGGLKRARELGWDESSRKTWDILQREAAC